jgi:uncharacterized membrane protein
MSPPPPVHGFRLFTNLAFEIVLVIFTLVPILLLVYFYSEIPERVPEYLNLRGDVEVWGSKSFFTVFRIPLMALDLQALCLLAKLGAWQQSVVPLDRTDPSRNRDQTLKLTESLFDWFRVFIAIKLGASSLEVIFYSVERFNPLTTLTRVTSWLSSILGVAGAIYFGYRLLRLERKSKGVALGSDAHEKPHHDNPVGGFCYSNPTDPTWFADKYRPNLGNKWLYVFAMCLLLLPLLMFGPMLF